jgi:hypothetical protein
MEVMYEPAADGLGYPESEQILWDYLAALDVPSMRQHGWDVWAALTAPSASGLPIVLTWYLNREIFGEGHIDAVRTFLPQFLTPLQKTLGDADPLISFNVYDQTYRSHVRANGYEWRDTLQQLIGVQPVIADFPTGAIAVKTVWWPVRHDGLTAFPVWDDEPIRPTYWGIGIGRLVDMGYFGPLTPAEREELLSHEKHGNDWETFRRVVAIDPTRSSIPPNDTAEITFFDPNDLELETNEVRVARVVPLSDFFHVRLTNAATVKALNEGLTGQIATRFWGRPLDEQDSVALVAVHVTTRELPDWVWATFWWHDEPDAAPFGDDRPAEVQPPFDHLRMRVAYSADVPLADDGSPHIAFNPYLEAGFALGPESNCLGCHQRATLTPDGPGDVFPVHRGSLSPDDPFFTGKLRTHFLWSMVFRPRPRP